MEEQQLSLQYLCSDAFWTEENYGVEGDSGLFHFTAHIKDRPAALIIDEYALVNLVSIEVVHKLKLIIYSKKIAICIG